MKIRRFAGLLLTLGLLASASSIVAAGQWMPDASVGNIEQHQKLYQMGRTFLDANYSEADGFERNKSTLMVRESAYYAYGLLLTGESADRTRAETILRHVIAAQDTRPDSPSRGAFLWNGKDKWEDLKNPDFNSAEFVGMALADILDLDQRGQVLDNDLRQPLADSATLAVQAAMKRDVDPGYSNIALLSVAVGTAGQKLLHVPGSGDFAEKKLDTLLKLAGKGLCYEYLSPTYTAVDFQGAYFAKKFSYSDEFAAKAQTMIDKLWKQVASAYHPPTYQLGGPYNRAYGDDMLTYAAGLKYFLYLGLDGQYPLSDVDVNHGWDQAGMILMADLPISARPEFKQPPPAWQEFIAIGPDDGKHPTRHLAQYRDGNFILGTVREQDEWKQKRNLVAFWRSESNQPPGYQIGFCIDESNESLPDGYPYAKIRFSSLQNKSAAIVTLTTTAALPDTGGCVLGFNPAAKANDDGTKIEDGDTIAYLYPITSESAHYSSESNGKTVHLTRPWTSADRVGDTRVLAYLVVFRPANDPAPTVTELSLKPADHDIAVAATIDSQPLRLLVKH